MIKNSLPKVNKEYNDLPYFGNLLLNDPKLTEEDREVIKEDLDSYKIRYNDLLKSLSEKDEM